MRRQLTQEEKQFCQKQIRRWRDTKFRMETKLREFDHMISGGLYVNYLEKLDELQQKKRDIASQLHDADLHIVTLSDQLERGIEQKEKTEEE